MDEEQKCAAILSRLKELNIPVDQPLYTLGWEDLARVMVETEGFEDAAKFPTDVLVEALNLVQEGLETLDWYGNLQNSLRLARQAPLASNPAASEDGHLESDYEDRVSGIDG